MVPRRLIPKLFLLSLVLAGAAVPGRAASEEPLEIITWPGAYGAALEKAIAIPFSERTGKKVLVKHYPHDDRIFRFKDFVTHGSALDLEAKDALKACSSGQLLPLNDLRLADAPDQTPAQDDFLVLPHNNCAVASSRFNHVIAYQRDEFTRPLTSIAALFDLKNFPGLRGLRKEPETLLIWAALAAGIPHQSVYDVLLSTGGAELVFEQLDLIRTNIIWWEKLDKPVSWLTEGKVVMASTFHPQIYQANRDQPKRLAILPEGQVSDFNVWVVPVSAKDKKTAKAFIAYATSARPLAAFASLVPYGPARRSSGPYIAGEMHRHLPATQDSRAPSIGLDHQWWLEHGDYLKKRFAAWAMTDPMESEGRANKTETILSTDE